MSHCGNSLMASDVHHFMCLFAICMKFFCECFEVRDCPACCRTGYVAREETVSSKVVGNSQ